MLAYEVSMLISEELAFLYMFFYNWVLELERIPLREMLTKTVHFNESAETIVNSEQFSSFFNKNIKTKINEGAHIHH